jgi:hypothetical protein
MVVAIHASRFTAEGSDAPYVSIQGLSVAGLLSMLLIALGFVGLDM